MIKYISFFHCILNLSYGQYQPHRKCRKTVIVLNGRML
nr:MAG TPA: hypothetical protein [Caudoviricetes sp.]DAJ38025.1 MAG TPA: hypothetical protein [Bacteriophage sp.]DAJ98321.1 MAG TPA: hypothetical protein [Bacteriophage sp.]DAR49074.1 MAG TPA: hypothetical protein [Caudoviricetes sp.]DAU59672.1 MAG TPA: hypothetical protein [Bacteriophage sp.]